MVNGVVELSAVQQTDASAPDSRSAPRRADMDPPVVTRWRTGDEGKTQIICIVVSVVMAFGWIFN